MSQTSNESICLNREQLVMHKRCSSAHLISSGLCTMVAPHARAMRLLSVLRNLQTTGCAHKPIASATSSEEVPAMQSQHNRVGHDQLQSKDSPCPTLMQKLAIFGWQAVCLCQFVLSPGAQPLPYTAQAQVQTNPASIQGR